MWGCLSLARRCDCRQPWSAARRREMDRCTAWCRLPAHRRLLIHLMNQHRHRRSSVCRNMCVTAELQVLGSFGDGDVGVASAQLQQRLSVDTNGLCATLREVLGDDRYESLTAIPRLQPTRLQLPNRKRRPLPGASGDRRASAKRRQSQSDSPRCASAKRSCCARGAALSWPAKLPGRGCHRAGVHRGTARAARVPSTGMLLTELYSSPRDETGDDHS